MNIPIFIVPGLLVAIVLAMPFIAKRFIGQIFNVAFTIALLIALFGMTWYSYSKDGNDEAHQKSIAKEKQQAARICELARYEGIPPTGALTLLRNDPKTQGPRLFTQNCASCHDHAAGTDDDIKAEKSSAPNLAGFASREWIAGLLDPKQVAGPKYFGNTKLRKMADFVKETFGELDDDQKKSVEKLVIALSAEAKLPSQRETDAKATKEIAEGRTALIEEFGCVNCHKFYDKPGVPNTPDLTGYGSAKWIAGIISNPTDKRFYGKNNERMPGYAASPDPAQNTLNEKQIKMLTDWLRGDWYEEEKPE
jgi:ubiquinol-cytochrome c reductase cytochrome b subunit